MNLLRIYKIRFFFIHYILMLICASIGIFFITPSESPIKDVSFHTRILSSCIIAPIIETITDQFIPKIILNFIGIKNYFLVLVIMSVYFSVLHPAHLRQNNIVFSISFTLMTVVLVNYYLQVQRREGTKQAVIKTMILHSIYNLTLILI